MTATEPVATAAPRRRAPRPARIVGYLVAATVQVVLLVLINVTPGWDALSFLTSETTEVLPAVNASLWAALVVNLLWVLADPRWFRALGDAVSAAVSFVAALTVWNIFPFDLDDTWTSVVRVLVLLGVVGTAIGVVAGIVTCVRELGRDE